MDVYVANNVTHALPGIIFHRYTNNNVMMALSP
jgi:hypothetical protein